MGLMDKARDAAARTAVAAQEAGGRLAERGAALEALQKWDYKVIFVHKHDQEGLLGSGSIEERLQKLGRDGWEVVAAIGDRIILKRPLV